ncbi:MAG: HEAT repeat domain-containing protein [Candidatus Kapabacteria bacterium]|nr:HEAT repeat domain-containing protein [Candidatus Kapabacteria bacterium]
MRPVLHPAFAAALLVAGFVLLPIISVAQVQSPVDLGNGFLRLQHAVDTSLSLLGMRKADLSMPSDMLDRDRHRSPFHDQLFTDPLASVAWTDSVAASLLSRNGNVVRGAIAQLASSAGLDVATPRTLSLGRTADSTASEVVGRMGNKARSMPVKRLLAECIGLVITAKDSLATRHSPQLGYGSIGSVGSFLTALDSLWSPSEEDDKLTLWQVHDNEISGTGVTKSVSANIDPLLVSDICSIGNSLYVELRQALDRFDGDVSTSRDSLSSFVLSMPFGRVAIGGAGNDAYSGSYALIIDVGGDDTYDVEAASVVDSMTPSLSVVIDLDGNDLYRGGDHVLGSGRFGVGILIDESGDDTYAARDFSIGSGTYGFGIVQDASGNDVYRSRSNSQGAGVVGIGLLLDDAGHDLYICAAQSQAFAATNGVGVLSDLSGNDRYIAVSPFADVLRYDDHQVSFVQGAALGSRPTMSGGTALLVDAAGNDLYSCDIYGQGTGYWFGLGALIDLGGDDRYDAYQYAQGSGVHFAVGVLTDARGDDVYRSHGVSQGCGHDIATGLLRDHEGDDSYVCESLSLGAGNANAVSILYDESGNDSYSALNTGNTLGYSDMRRGYGMIGLFIDAAGGDVYGETIRNDTAIVRSTYGLMLDAELVGASEVKQPAAQARPVSLTSRIDSLFVQASASHLRFQSDVAPARKEIGRRGIEALKFLESKFSTQMPRERITLETALPDLYASDRDSTIELLRRALRSSDNATVSTATTIIGKVKCVELLADLQQMLNDASWRRRRLAAATIGEVSDTQAVRFLKGACIDEHPYVRQRAAYHHSRLLPSDSTHHRRLLSDTLQIVRMALIEGLIKAGKRPMSQILALIGGHTDERSKPSVLRLLLAADTTAGDLAMFSSWWSRQSVHDRQHVGRFSASLPRPLAAIMASAGTGKKKRARR